MEQLIIMSKHFNRNLTNLTLLYYKGYFSLNMIDYYKSEYAYYSFTHSRRKEENLIEEMCLFRFFNSDWTIE